MAEVWTGLQGTCRRVRCLTWQASRPRRLPGRPASFDELVETWPVQACHQSETTRTFGVVRLPLEPARLHHSPLVAAGDHHVGRRLRDGARRRSGVRRRVVVREEGPQAQPRRAADLRRCHRPRAADVPPCAAGRTGPRRSHRCCAAAAGARARRRYRLARDDDLGGRHVRRVPAVRCPGPAATRGGDHRGVPVRAAAAVVVLSSG